MLNLLLHSAAEVTDEATEAAILLVLKQHLIENISNEAAGTVNQIILIIPIT